MPIVQIIIDRTTSMVIEGVYQFDRTQGGTLVAPSGSAFPSTPLAGEWFWRTDLLALYRRNDGNTAWDPVSAVPVSSSVKAGVLIPGAFSGNPKKATVTFGTAFSAIGFAIAFSPITDGSRTFSLSVESKTVSGFVLNLNANNLAGLVEVGWHCIVSAS